MYDWVRTCMLSADGLYSDHIGPAGIDGTKWSYNQGTMIGANVLMWQATGQASYLRRAKSLARVSLGYFDAVRMQQQPPYFVAIFFDNLMALDAVRPDPAYRAATSAYADWAWKARRDKRTSLFNFQTDGGRVLEQAAMVRIYATLAGAASRR
jgi:rhamnogalacturonyl hydrolase YesR